MSTIQTIKNICWHLPKSIFYNIRYGFPARKLILIGVTGTDGKTTTATLIHHVLQQNGYKAGLITTIGAKIGDKEFNTGLHTTSPDPSLLQKLFSDMVHAGLDYAVCEVTSHALDQYRYWGCNFEVSLITNISHEHLDYHKTIKSYIRSKARLFIQSKVSVLNRDDISFKIIKDLITSDPISYSIENKSDYQAKNIKLSDDSLEFSVDDERIVTDSPYEYQVYNILAALAVCRHIGVSSTDFSKNIRHFPDTKGRREEVANEYGIRTIVDFAHTPAALDSTLSSLKKVTKGKLIVIFGATGGRDKTKRPSMGKNVTEIADIAIVTADDTRTEDVNDINRQIISGVDLTKVQYHENSDISDGSVTDIRKNLSKHCQLFNIPNRQDAFNLAVKLAVPGDTIIACGKGHETTILHGTTEYPWSETEAFRTAFRFLNLT
ncbi:MAG TPA: UDP-N-acetylmuramoyl-L-alanyl-D-glutamate--2,6-diaminopimelate ligase [Patescibacteria group bacterium]